MKSCLKTAPNTPPNPPSPPPTDSRRAQRPPCLKHVSFCAQGEEEVFTADDWDRTPSTACRKLSYEEILELKSIQRSLPHAEQTPDSSSYLPRFLKQVPINLLPLLSDSSAASSTPPSPSSLVSSPLSPPLHSAIVPPPVVAHPPSPPSTPPLPEIKPVSSPVVSITPSPATFTSPLPPPPAPRRKLAMAFLPLLPTSETPTLPTQPKAAEERSPSQPPALDPTHITPLPVSENVCPAKPVDAAAQPSAHSQLLTPSGTPAMGGTLPLQDLPLADDAGRDVGTAPLTQPCHPRPTPAAPSADATSLGRSAPASSAPLVANDTTESSSSHSKQLPTPGSTPALTPCTLTSESESESTAEAPQPVVRRSPPRRACPQLLDAFPAPPTDLPTANTQQSAGGSNHSAARTKTLTPPPSLPDMLSARLSALATAATPSPPESNEASPSVGSQSAAAVLSQSYFYLNLARPRTSAAPPTLPAARSPFLHHYEPSLASGGGALPESPFIDPMMGGRELQRAIPPTRGMGEPTWRRGEAGAFALALPPPGTSAAALRSLRLEALPSPVLVPPSPLLLSSGEVARVGGAGAGGEVLPLGLSAMRRVPLVPVAGASSPLAQHD